MAAISGLWWDLCHATAAIWASRTGLIQLFGKSYEFTALNVAHFPWIVKQIAH